MYVSEAKWYKKQKRREVFCRRLRRCGVACVLGIGLLFSAGFCATQVFAGESAYIPSGFTTKTEEVVKVLAMPVVTEADIKMLVDYRAEDSNGKQFVECKEQERILPGEENSAEEKCYKIVIDAGHGGEDEGCSFGGELEKDINLSLAHALKQKLELLGFQVTLTRNDDSKLTLEERVELANDAKADAFISIHQNSCEDKSVAGVETWYYDGQDGASERLALLAQQYMTLYTKARDRGVIETDVLYVIRECEMPSCLVETGFLSNDKERGMLSDEAYCEKLVQGLADAIELYFYPKKMYLTFDDGPSAENTTAILDILKEKGIKATFFVVGENVEKHPEVAKRIVEEGHTIGIHCYDHSYETLYSSVDSYIEDFEKAKQLVYEVTGEEVWCFRFPGGSINSHNKEVYEEIIAMMTEKGYVYYDWNASLEDAVKRAEPEVLIQNAKESTLQRKKIVMLAHDIVAATAQCLEELIEVFPEYEMLPLAPEVEPIQF